MQKMKTLLLSTAIILPVMLGGCARDISSTTYSDATVGEASQTFRGTIVTMRKVNVGPEKLEDNVAGGLAGGVLGGVVGNQFGKGGGKTAATAVGAIGGAVAGAFAEKALKSQDGFEYTVQLDNGDMRTIVQGTEHAMSVGQRVLIIVGQKNRSRVVPDTSGR